MKIMIAGAGAMGSRFGYMLTKGGHEVILIDGWQDHIDQIKNEGLKVNFNGKEEQLSIPIYHQSEAKSIDFTADLVILFTKAMQLDGMLTNIKGLLGTDTKCLCLLNGIGHEDVVKKYVKEDNILLGNTMWTAGLEGPGHAKLFGDGTIDLQNLIPDEASEQVAREVVDVLNSGNLNARYAEDILSSIYRKACLNGTMNGLCTILDTNMAGFGETSEADALVENIVDEFIAVAAVQDIPLDKAAILEQVKNSYNRETIGLHFPSMHQDLIKNNRLTEIDYINGAIVRKGEMLGIATPYCRFLTQLVHVKEQIMGAK